MLRLDVDSDFPYAIPPTNPFVGHPTARPEIWARGLRNPWRFSFDSLTGDLFIADVGQSNREEVNFQPANSPGGENYGWRKMEGARCYNPATNCNNGALTLPILTYSHTRGCSIVGGYRYRGSAMPQHYGTYFYADYCTGKIWGATPRSGGRWRSTRLLDLNFRISTFGEDEDRELYIARYVGVSGALYRLISQGEGP
jgi:glucose/arabinose dehydrogenase